MDSEKMREAFLNIAESLEVAIRALEVKAAVLKRIQSSLYNQSSDSPARNTLHQITPENLFDSIRMAIKSYEEVK